MYASSFLFEHASKRGPVFTTCMTGSLKHCDCMEMINGSTQRTRIDTDKGNLRGDIAEIPKMYCTIFVPTDDEVRPRVRYPHA